MCGCCVEMLGRRLGILGGFLEDSLGFLLGILNGGLEVNVSEDCLGDAWGIFGMFWDSWEGDSWWILERFFRIFIASDLIVGEFPGFFEIL